MGHGLGGNLAQNSLFGMARDEKKFKILADGKKKYLKEYLATERIVDLFSDEKCPQLKGVAKTYMFHCCR